MGKSTEHLENFDDLFAGNPVDIEKNMKALLPKAEKRRQFNICSDFITDSCCSSNAKQNSGS